MVRKLLNTDNDLSLTMVRVVLGMVFFAHGAQKMLGWFGGDGFSGSMGFFTQKLGIPPTLAFLAIAAEFFGGLGLLAGLLSRVAALGIACKPSPSGLPSSAQGQLRSLFLGHASGDPPCCRAPESIMAPR
jgi:hypothetical protein